MLKKLLKNAQQRKATLLSRSTESTDVAEVRSIGTQLEGVNEEIRDLEAAIAGEEARDAAAATATATAAAANDDPAAEGRAAANGDPGPEARGQNMALASFGAANGGAGALEARAIVQEAMETRGAALKNKEAVQIDYIPGAEERAITVGSGELLVEDKYSRQLRPKFNEVSGLIDRVNAVPLQGGESYGVSFEISDGEGGYTDENGDYVEAEPTYGIAVTGKACITAYAEVSKYADKLPNVQYTARVANSVRNAVRKKITKQLIIGAGTSSTITGIYNVPVAIMPLASDIEISAVDDTTLDKLVFGYGGSEDIEGDAVVVLSKDELSAFNDIRQANGDKYYEITLPMNGNTGIISSSKSFAVPFIINSACNTTATATVGQFTMVYGKLAAFEMPIFSKLDVQRSDDFKFKSGAIAFRADIFVGGNVTMYKGFVRVKKAAAV